MLKLNKIIIKVVNKMEYLNSPVFRTENSPEYRVNDTCSWNMEIIDDVFDQATKKIILSIPLAPNATCDTVFWGMNKNGRYSVKSGYWFGHMRTMNPMQNAYNSLWCKVWNIQGPPKMRHFLWCACKGSLSVNEVRFQRHILSWTMQNPILFGLPLLFALL